MTYCMRLFKLNLLMLEEEDIAKSYSREEADWI